MTIHHTNPFAEPDRTRYDGSAVVSAGRCRCGPPVTGADRAGLTVSSLMVANGEPARILALLDPDAALPKL